MSAQGTSRLTAPLHRRRASSAEKRRPLFSLTTDRMSFHLFFFPVVLHELCLILLDPATFVSLDVPSEYVSNYRLHQL